MKTLLLVFMAVCLTSAQQRDGDCRPVVLAFGDSLTAGFGVPRGLGYPEQLQKLLDDGGYAYRVVNMGLPGDTSARARARMTRALALTPAMVILELGGNDRGSGVASARTEASLDELIRLFRSAGATVVLAQVDRGLGQVFTTLAAKYTLTVIPEFLKGVEGHADLTIADGRHPNAEGYTIVSRTVMTAIAPLLSSRSAASPCR